MSVGNINVRISFGDSLEYEMFGKIPIDDFEDKSEEQIKKEAKEFVSKHLGFDKKLLGVTIDADVQDIELYKEIGSYTQPEEHPTLDYFKSVWEKFKREVIETLTIPDGVEGLAYLSVLGFVISVPISFLYAYVCYWFHIENTPYIMFPTGVFVATTVLFSILENVVEPYEENPRHKILEDSIITHVRYSRAIPHSKESFYNIANRKLPRKEKSCKWLMAVMTIAIFSVTKMFNALSNDAIPTGLSIFMWFFGLIAAAEEVSKD